ncbi:uncharacterized protein K489DRAFT_37330 [Dissoconium aciculare CBS 342.82]|uniref:Uncharacterized protein n=1 Tax=Dissoconium aciculare CBS 342.82 TaxID=1314786 RepID=A0A6J3LY71_9PEZI|nr:uncharacterized protein K489DRAFT_37330 [Dissoconium aciculare CBS 342.82]KAF1820603.1 hypothetical protein K489DRAFT_37330 [Dissoconium aciculare CBS 342.82]
MPRGWQAINTDDRHGGVVHSSHNYSVVMSIVTGAPNQRSCKFGQDELGTTGRDQDQCLAPWWAIWVTVTVVAVSTMVGRVTCRRHPRRHRCQLYQHLQIET